MKNEHSESEISSTALDCVVLFDIDGTLLAGPTAGTSAGFDSMMRAVVKVAGRKGKGPFVDFAGRTDLHIARALLQSCGMTQPTDELVGQVVDRYLEFLKEAVKTKPYTAIGSPEAAVEALRGRNALVGLGTGNVREGGKIKLESAGIGHLFDWSRGGFGDDGDSRAELLRYGVKSLDPDEKLPVIIVGDTPRDVEAAQAIGALCIGIPYLQNDAQALKQAGADAIVTTIDSSLGKVVERLIQRDLDTSAS